MYMCTSGSFMYIQALISQLKQDKCYQEGRHWKRIRQIGFGGSGTTFCIQDLQSDFCLALKEVPLIN